MNLATSTENTINLDVGLSELEDLVKRLRGRGAGSGAKHPVVFVSGFSGWDAPLFGTLNYWGGFADLPKLLHQKGFQVIVVRIGPLSSNWERACEVYAQLEQRNFDTPETKPGRLIEIDYGQYWPERKSYDRKKDDKPAIIYGDLSKWTWGPDSPVHFICHSQGGNTVRYLAKLMETGKKEYHDKYFENSARDNWIKSIITLGTPHKGTTITEVIRELAPKNWRKLLAQLISSVSYLDPLERFYDLHLDHWGFRRGWRGQSEDFDAMLMRLQGEGEGSMTNWINSKHNGFYDNSIEGVAELNKFAAEPTRSVYFFTMSFTATIPLPNIDLTHEELATFPTRIGDLFQPIRRFSFLPMGWLGGLAAKFVNASFDAVVDQGEFATWVTRVANNHLKALGYPYTLPEPGPQIPRSDVLPPMAASAYGIGGYKLNPVEIEALGNEDSKMDFQPNDGVVNTVSMRGPGPGKKYVKDVKDLLRESADITKKIKGCYCHMGPNISLDHADEIGVFFDDSLPSDSPDKERKKVVAMYENIATLLGLLP